MSRWMLPMLFATNLFAHPALAATRADVHEASSQAHDEVRLRHRFESAERQWTRGQAHDNHAVMLSAGKKLTDWVDDALRELPRQVLRDVHHGNDDSTRAMYAESLLNLRNSLRRNGGDGWPAADSQTAVLLGHLHADLDARVDVRNGRERRIKEAFKASR